MGTVGPQQGLKGWGCALVADPAATLRLWSQVQSMALDPTQSHVNGLRCQLPDVRSEV